MTTRGLYSEHDSNRRVREDSDERGLDEYRSAYGRDYIRLIHSPAFRRLQGKTQLFPGFESDFFRNRLTHSLEVAQIAKSIALRLNQTVPQLKDDPIQVDIVELAGLAHDLGHPPFGHNGEAALDECMRTYGGFEGNAQTFRIVARLEKKCLEPGADAFTKYVGVDVSGKDYRAGLNWSARSLAAVLKYDQKIPVVRDNPAVLVKGYYSSDSDMVDWVRKCTIPDCPRRKLKTIECQIMDLADDIAYSTYDMEDAFKAGFLTPLGLISMREPLRAKVAERVSAIVGESTSAQDLLELLLEMFDDVAETTDPVVAYQNSGITAENGYERTALTSDLVSEAVNAVMLDYNAECPPLSAVTLEPRVLRRVEILKHLTFSAVILSPKLKVAEFRGKEIIKEIFGALASDSGSLLLPNDYQELYRRFSADSINRHRVLCDFIAGMTDAYAIEFYARLKSENARTIFKPF